MTDFIFSTDVHNFEATVIQASHNTPVLIDLWADWCSPCRVIAPLLEKLSTEFQHKLLIAKIEVDDDENMKIAGHYKVRGFPTLILFEHGIETGRFSGAKPLSFIRQFIEDNSSARVSG